MKNILPSFIIAVLMFAFTSTITASTLGDDRKSTETVKATKAAECQESGAIKLYNFFYEVNSETQSINTIIYVEKGKTFESVTSENYEKVLKSMTADYPKLSKKVGKSKYNFKHDNRIIKEYNTFKNLK